ncbi:SET domain-containing protein-lysine N-methyltransferase [bacterium]|nr:SET domain-containing protein-lysine N-methyltransferase [bacterium]
MSESMMMGTQGEMPMESQAAAAEPPQAAASDPGRAWQVRPSWIHGNGIFAARDIRKGEMVIEYLGEIISEEEAMRRYDDDNQRRHHTFLFGLADGSYIDGGAEGNEAKYINHSCEPNCEAFEEDGRILIYAIRRIREGDELTYDYKLQRDGKPKKSWKKLYACGCGSKKCRGTMLWLEPKKKGKKGKKA